MRSAWLLGFATIACAACGVTGRSSIGPTVDTLPTPDGNHGSIAQPREDPWAAFATLMLDATHALHEAAIGNPYDDRWQCADAKKDIRSTSPETGKTFLAKGTPEYLLTALSDITLTSPIDPSARTPDSTPDVDDESQQRARPTRIVVRGNVVVMADARVRWFEVSARATSSAPGGDEPQTLLKRLPNEMRGALSDLITTLTSSCVLPYAEASDFAPLPIPQSKKESALERVEHDAAELPHVCEMVARASGPWDARVAKLAAFYSSGDAMAALFVDLRIEQGRLCLGRATSDRM